MITIEVHEFGHRWFDTVGGRGSAEDQAAFFLDKHAFVIYMNTFHHTLPDSAPLKL